LFALSLSFPWQSEYNENECKPNQVIDVAISVANMSSCINSAANFLVYMLRGKKFRDMFLQTYCCCLR